MRPIPLSLADKPAFPPVERFDGQTGMTFREYVTVQAMAAILSNGTLLDGIGWRQSDPEDVVKCVTEMSVEYADALVKQLTKR